MTLIKSISGIRGTIGGSQGDNLTPIDVVKFTTAYAIWLKQQTKKEKYKVIVGRDARISGPMVHQLVCGTLMGMGIDVLDAGLATTPTTEMAVLFEKADGGIILTASHNPAQWNALKLLDKNSEFISAEAGKFILEQAELPTNYATVYELGTYKVLENCTQKHIEAILQLPLVDLQAIKNANFTVAIDCVNSVGGTAIPALLTALGVKNVIPLYCEPTGHFPHNPEPLPEHLTELSQIIRDKKADVGFSVDPDVDRLAIVCENGQMFGEEYTLVAIADYILQHKKGNTVSNLSSTRALRDITEKHGGTYSASAVGELNVVTLMKQSNAVIGGEGNGGVIYPDLHYGRDALVGIALFLSYLAKQKLKCTELKATYPAYFISKNKIELQPDTNVDELLLKIKEYYLTQQATVNTIDGVKIDWAHGWVHLRKSNTEPIIRIYAESIGEKAANELAEKMLELIRKFISPN